ncbi:hypothetical protein [Microbulbifer marinus]|uniref:Uncharacterized protein n=1 Tax=Microbulbifer marinus TaxID=658218 RepID=A0A1H3Z973_9GAMM|nr:hypothetical protein [Microbulbifer marinus]SEA20230.1 hypothetical protein SAMN05216562_2265 [Microbulbifer marinus]
MALKAVNGVLAVLALTVLCTACGEREKREEVREEKEMAPAAGCCQKADNSCASPVTREQCEGLNGTFHEGGACQDDGTCGVQQPQ